MAKMDSKLILGRDNDVQREGAVIEIEKNKTAFNDAVYRAKLIIGSLELYENIRTNKLFETLLTLPQLYELTESEKPFVTQNSMVYELIKGNTPVSIEIRNNNNVLTVVPKIGKKDRGYFEFTEDGLVTAFEVLKTGKLPSVTHVETTSTESVTAKRPEE